MPRNCLFASILILVSNVARSSSEDTGSSGMKVIPDSCRNITMTTRHLTVPPGWPAKIKCVSRLGYTFHSPPPLGRCVITTEDTIVHNESIAGKDLLAGADFGLYLPSVEPNQNGSIYTSYSISISLCTAVSTVLLVEQSPSKETCGTATYRTNISNELRIGRPEGIACYVTNAPFYLRNETFQVKWYKDCNLVKTTERRREFRLFHEDIDIFRIANVDVNSSLIGEFTCSVTYKGFEMFLTKTRTCVKYISPNVPYTQHISAPKVQVTTGEDVVLTCGGITETPRMLSRAISWVRHVKGTEETICTVFAFDDGEESQKYKCIVLTNAKKAGKCFTDVKDAIEDEVRGDHRFNSSLVIRNFNASDVGNYTCHHNTVRSSTEVSFEISLVTWNSLIIILPAALGFILLVLLVIVVVMCVKEGSCKVTRNKKVERTSSVNSDKKSPGTLA